MAFPNALSVCNVLFATLFNSVILEWSVMWEGQSLMKRMYLIFGYDPSESVPVPFIDSTYMLLNAVVNSEILELRAPECGPPAALLDKFCNLFIMS